MIAHLNGRLTNLSEDSVVVECAGVGYRVHVAPPTLARLPEVGGTLRLPTWLAVREDAMTLYGFSSDEERELFEVLLAVNGVGPKVAQNLVASLAPARLVEAIGRGDEASLTQVTGVGKKLAQRIVVELSDKIGAMTFSRGEEHPFLGRKLAEEKTFSEQMAWLIDQEIAAIIKEAEQKADNVIANNRGDRKSTRLNSSHT